MRFEGQPPEERLYIQPAANEDEYELESLTTFDDVELFEESPERWLRLKRPDWSDDEITDALLRIEGAYLIESIESYNKHKSQEYGSGETEATK